MRSWKIRRQSQPTRRVFIVAHGAGGGLGRVERLLENVGRSLQETGDWAFQMNRLDQNRSTGTLDRFVRRLGFVLRVAIGCLIWRPNVVIFTHLNLATVNLLLSVLVPHARTVVVAHGVELWNPIGGIRRLALHRCTVVWAVSSFTRDLVVGNGNLSPDRVRLLPLALDDERYKALCEFPVISSGARILAVTRLDPRERYKGIDDLLRALPRVIARKPTASLTIVGDGDDRQRLEALAKDLEIANRVTLLDRVSDEELIRLYGACDVFALPSGREGFGIVYVEAMAAGKPVVAARAGGVPETVIEGVAGLMVGYGDSEAISGALIRLLQDREMRERLGEAGRRAVSAKFTFSIFVRRALALLDELSEGSRLGIADQSAHDSAEPATEAMR